MIVLSIWLTGVALADLAASFSGKPTSRKRCQFGVGLAAIAAVGESILFSLSPLGAATLSVFTLGSTWLWLDFRLSSNAEIPHPEAALSVFGTSMVIAMGTASFWTSTAPPRAIVDWINDLPVPAAASLAPEAFGLAIAVFLAQAATANGLVRSILSASGNLPTKGGRVEAGRFIGPLERTVIFGLGLFGELTAAVLVASAKSILRFPELATQGKNDPPLNEFSEYVVLGSLASWAFAISPLILFKGP